MATPRITALDRVLELTVLLQADMERSLPRLGLTQSRVQVVWVLAQHGPATQASLAATLGLAPRSVTGLVDALEETGFVTREPHPRDRRATLVTLTDHGRHVADTLVAGQSELAAQLFGHLGDTEIDRLVATLDGVLDRLRPLAEEPAR